MTEASHAGFGGLYTATQGLARALAEHQQVESMIRAGATVEGCSDADLCHAHGMWASSALVSLAWRIHHRRPLIVAPHGMLDPWALEQSALAKKAALATYEGVRLRAATCMHALCEAELDSIHRLDRRLRAFVVPNGVDLPNMAEVSAARDCYAGHNERKVLLYLGRIHPKKGIDLTLQGLASAFRADPHLRTEWTLEICGDGEPNYVDRLRRLALELRISDAVTFPGTVAGEEKARKLTRASAFVLASLSEGLPMAVLEAWAYGLPSLVSEACNLSRAVVAGAALCTPASQPPVSQGITELMHLDERERLALGGRARTYVERVHAWTEVAARMAGIYRWVTGGGPPPDPA